MNWLPIHNDGTPIPRKKIPVLPYAQFGAEMRAMLARPENRCAAYFAVASPDGGTLNFYALVARDTEGDVVVAAHTLDYYDEGFLESLAGDILALHCFEREMAELYGIHFKGSPWDKPLRYPWNRRYTDERIDNYPFYSMESQELHQVNVGPVHAGIIEPGAFRFLCDGEKVLHLEIALGYQHRGIESLIAAASGNPLRQIALAESIAGDTAVAHATAIALILESKAPRTETWVTTRAILAAERIAAIEMERLAMHIADISALCGDIAYQTGQVACEALRTLVINALQSWCGNRFGKGLVRPFGSHFRLSLELIKSIETTLDEVIRRMGEVGDNLLSTPSVLARFEGICAVTRGQALRVGAVGMAARSSGVIRDSRLAHNFALAAIPASEGGIFDGFKPCVRKGGDLMARLRLRLDEIVASRNIIAAAMKEAAGRWFEPYPAPDYSVALPSDSLIFSLVEGWRGEICHAALTGTGGGIESYKVVDPSVHNWLLLALSVRDAQISDFPLSNKSFNLSYCGHDL